MCSVFCVLTSNRHVPSIKVDAWQVVANSFKLAATTWVDYLCIIVSFKVTRYFRIILIIHQVRLVKATRIEIKRVRVS